MQSSLSLILCRLPCNCFIKKIYTIYYFLEVAENKYFIFHSYFYSTTKHEILQISNYNLLCSLDPPNKGWLFWVVGPKLINDTEYNWLHISRYVLDRYGVNWKEGDCHMICGRVRFKNFNSLDHSKFSRNM